MRARAEQTPPRQIEDSASSQLVADALRDSCAPQNNASEVTNAVRRGVCKEHEARRTCRRTRASNRCHARAWCSPRSDLDGKAFVAGDGRLRGLEPLRAALTSSAMMSLFSSTPAGKRPADAVGGPAVLQMATWRFVRRARSGSSCCYCGPSAASRPAGRWPAAVSPASWHGGWLFFCQ